MNWVLQYYVNHMVRWRNIQFWVVRTIKYKFNNMISFCFRGASIRVCSVVGQFCDFIFNMDYHPFFFFNGEIKQWVTCIANLPYQRKLKEEKQNKVVRLYVWNISGRKNYNVLAYFDNFGSNSASLPSLVRPYCFC